VPPLTVQSPDNPFPPYDISMSLELHPQLPVTIAPPSDDDVPSKADAAAELDETDAAEPDITQARTEDTSPPPSEEQIFFGADPLSKQPVSLQPWLPGDEPLLMTPHPPKDPEIKQAALTPEHSTPATEAGGQTIAGKGQVTGEGKRPKTPAERLGLVGKARAKAEKCLSNAIYFEARGEPDRGQMAVAQVVMNRVFSGYYPDNVCGVIYQNARRHLACQFTFACDGIPDVVTEPDAWAKAKKIARDTLDGKVWLPEVGRATHYHAYWVRRSWIHEMKKMYKLGVHTFYRPRAWGDGRDPPNWGPARAQIETRAKS
jgi:spore germination cell wall hydrolase CwlJ-like protein